MTGRQDQWKQTKHNCDREEKVSYRKSSVTSCIKPFRGSRYGIIHFMDSVWIG